MLGLFYGQPGMLHKESLSRKTKKRTNKKPNKQSKPTVDVFFITS